MRRDEDDEAVLKIRVIVSAAMIAWGGLVTTDAAEFTKEEDCVAGRKVVDRDNKTGTVVSVSRRGCQVLLDETGRESSYLFWTLRGVDTSDTTKNKLVNGIYNCYPGSGATSNSTSMDIRIDGPDIYQDGKGNRGRYRLESSGQIVFESGPFREAKAELLPGPRIGLDMTGGTSYDTTCSLKR